MASHPSAPGPVTSLPQGVVTLADHEQHARLTIDEPTWAYLFGAAADELTLAHNIEAWRERTLLPRVLKPLAGGGTRVRLVGRTLAQGDVFGTIESVKAVSELFTPVGGEVVAVNTDLPNKPEVVNTDPHGTWMVKIAIANPDEAASLLSSDQYEQILK